MSISIPDEKMDDYARDCVVRLANRVDDSKLRERLLQMAREWKAAAIELHTVPRRRAGLQDQLAYSPVGSIPACPVCSESGATAAAPPAVTP